MEPQARWIATYLHYLNVFRQHGWLEAHPHHTWEVLGITGSALQSQNGQQRGRIREQGPGSGRCRGRQQRCRIKQLQGEVNGLSIVIDELRMLLWEAEMDVEMPEWAAKRHRRMWDKQRKRLLRDPSG